MVRFIIWYQIFHFRFNPHLVLSDAIHAFWKSSVSLPVNPLPFLPVCLSVSLSYSFVPNCRGLRVGRSNCRFRGKILLFNPLVSLVLFSIVLSSYPHHCSEYCGTALMLPTVLYVLVVMCQFT